MKQVENECVCCELPCLGVSCPNKNVVRYYCDHCGEEEELYYFDNEELCIYCIKKLLEKVEE